jgi:hypothetical protein
MILPVFSQRVGGRLSIIAVAESQFRKRQKRFFGCRFALTWLSTADKTRALNDRR